MAGLLPDPAEQLRIEKIHLRKAERDIEEGRRRLRRQQQLLDDLQASGHDLTQAERLIRLLQQTLMEWERHRVLIEERITQLERLS